ncbi:MAG TPA: DNA polymerase/3'-5' exonuclease PolX [Armatimonadetes bacterium]|jgi:DNA polymerase (family 10)|nr:DNA polymerase/3'-5' exonuclease PolX [Armatimonadota bacterium]
MKNAEAAELLQNIADMLEIKGESPFRVRAYRDAARAIESLAEPIEAVAERDELEEIPGVGESIAAKLAEYLETGTLAYYEDLREQVRPGLAELLEVPGIGPKKAKLFYEQLGIDSIEKLEEAARDHKLRTLPRIGPKTEEGILNAIERLRGRSERTSLGVALPSAREFLEIVRGLKEVHQADLAGSLRRRRDTIGDLDLLASSDDPARVVDQFVALPGAKSILAHGATKGTIVTAEHLQIDLRVVKPEEYGAALQYFTGSKAHNIHLRALAEAAGYKVNEYGVFRTADDRRVAGETEEGVYRTLGLEWIPPELREDRGEIEAAASGRLPDLVELADIRGDLHLHSNWSDGRDSLEQMVEAARARGYEYVVISDHSVSMGFVHGLTLERIQEQRERIAELNERYPDIRILQGTEVNIRADGSLDYEDEVLAEFDVVTASVHSGMGMDRERMTRRILRAVRNPHVDILGHPTGRILGRRDPYDVDLQAVIRAAAESGTALEINAQPDRLDLKDTDARLVAEAGAMVAINSDAHSVEQLGLMEYGISTARRGWIERKHVLNALPLEQLLRRLGRPTTPARYALAA